MPNLLALVIFPFAPFLSFLMACLNLREKANGVVFVLFYALFGFCHSFEDIRADSFRKAVNFKEHFSYSLSDILEQYSNGEIMDIYETTLFSYLRHFTDDPHIMMMVVGFIGGFFTLLLLKRIANDAKINYSVYITILIFLIIMRVSPVQMGGIRNFTALAIFAYSVIRFIIDRRNIWILGIIAAPLIHFGFIVYSIGAIIFRIFPINWNKMLWPTIVVCIASLFLDTSSWSNIMGWADQYIYNEAIGDRTDLYTDIDVNAEFDKSLTTKFLDIQNKISACFTIFLLLYLKKRRTIINAHSYSSNILNLTLFFIFIGYIFISLSVVGQRYLELGIILLYMSLISIYQIDRSKNIKLLIIATPFAYSIHIAWTIYNCYCNTGLGIYFLPLPALIL